MKAKQFLKDRKLDKGRLTMHLNGADYSVDLQNLLKEYANQRVIDELEKILKDKYDAYSDPEIYDHPENFVVDADDLEDRIKELKQ